MLWNVSASIVKGPKNTQSYSLASFWKGSSQDIKMPKKAIYLEHYKRRYKGLILKVWNSIFLCILLFSYKAQYFISIISILTYRTTGISASFLKISNWCFSNCIYTISYKRYTRYLTSIVHRQCLNSWCRIYLCASKNMLNFSISQTNNFITSRAWEMWTGSCQLSTQNLANGWLSFQLGLKFKDQDWLNLWI